MKFDQEPACIRALNQGEVTYFSERPCFLCDTEESITLRYTMTGRCVECARLRRERGRVREGRPQVKGMRERSKLLKLPTYKTKPCKKCGCTERHTDTGRCCTCHPKHKDHPRNKAREAGKTTYRGKPCKHCGCTTRYVSNAVCINAPHLRVNSARAVAEVMGYKIYQGMPCEQCGGTERYTSVGYCVTCQKRRVLHECKN